MVEEGRIPRSPSEWLKKEEYPGSRAEPRGDCRAKILLIELTNYRGCSIKCVKVRKVIINNFDHGKERNEEKREAITIE